MAEYIELAAAERELIERIRRYHDAQDKDAARGADAALKDLRQLPVDSREPALRCCDCRWLGFKDFRGICTHARGLVGTVSPSDFCSRAEADEPSRRRKDRA